MRKFAPNGKFGVPAVSGTIVQTFSTADATHAARTASAPAAATAAALTVADGAGTNTTARLRRSRTPRTLARLTWGL